MDVPIGAWAAFFQFAYVVAAMIFIGLAAAPHEIVDALRDRRLLARVLAVNIVVVPLVGLLLVAALELPRDAEAAIVLLAAAPGGANALQFTGKVKGQLAFAAGVLFVLAAASIPLAPAVTRLALPAQTVTAPYGRLFALMAVFIAAPLLAGFAVRRRAGRLAGKLVTPFNVISTGTFVVAVILSMAAKKEAARATGGATVAAMLALVIAGMAAGWWAGGPDRGTRRVAAVATGMRNAAVALVIANASFPDSSVDTAVLVFLLVAVPPNLAFTLYQGARERRRG